MLKDAQKTYFTPEGEKDGGKVFIPETCEESNSDSDSFGEKMRRLNEGQSSKIKGGGEQQWNVHIQGVVKEIPSPMSKKSVLEIPDATSPAIINEGGIPHNSPEIFLSDDNIINTQDSQPSEEAVMVEMPMPQHKGGEELPNPPQSEGVKGSSKGQL